MHVAVTVFAIAIGTALLALLIVAVDLDLAVIRGWQNLFPSSTAASRTREPTEWPVPDLRPVAPWSPEPVAAPVYHARLDEAEEWLAAAAAHRLGEYRQGLYVGAGTPATRLQEVLAARRTERDERAA